MDLNNSFTVPVPIDDAWRALLDVEQVVNCVPGAMLDSVEDDVYTGRVKVKLGAIQLTYRGQARFAEVDEGSRRVVIHASGKETKGAGTAQATVTTSLQSDGTRTEVHVHTDLALTGRPAQFGRGVMEDVGGKLLEQFAQNLSQQLGSAENAHAPLGVTHAASDAGAVSGTANTDDSVQPGRHRSDQDGPEPINLLATAGKPVLKRLALPVVLAILVVAVVWAVVSR